MKDLCILSLGYTRGLWEDERSQGDSYSRLLAYSRHIKEYHCIVNSSKRHRLTKPRQLVPNFWAYPTNAFTPVDSLLRMIKIGLTLAQRVKFDIVQAQDPLMTGLAALVISKALRIPLNTCVYGSDPFDPYWCKTSSSNWISGPIARSVLRASTGVQVDGSATLRNLSRHGIGKKMLALKPMIPTNIADFISATDDGLRAQYCVDGVDRLVLFVGRIVPQKNLFFLLDVSERVVEQYPNVRFLCVGDGWQLEQLKKETKKRNLTEYIQWIGAKPHKDIVKYMAACDLFVLPSRHEGFARVLMEAAATAKPIVTSAVSGSDDVVLDGKSGYILPVDDLQRFVSRIVELLNEPDLAAGMGLVGKRHMQDLVQRYTGPTHQIRIWEDLVAN